MSHEETTAPQLPDMQSIVGIIQPFDFYANFAPEPPSWFTINFEFPKYGLAFPEKPANLPHEAYDVARDGYFAHGLENDFPDFVRAAKDFFDAERKWLEEHAKAAFKHKEELFFRWRMHYASQMVERRYDALENLP